VTHRAKHNPVRSRGFTLMEALVAVIGVAILAVGLASIFSAISKTVTTGRRVSAINNYAAVVERVLRDDFARMTREGFLVIRNEYALNTAGVPLSREAIGSGRVRRIDEVMFFARGQFESARAPIDADFVARSGAASIYYGHGQQKLEGTFGFATPLLDETNEGPQLRLGISDFDNSIGEVNPNFYAGDWTLLRKVRLLKNPQPHPFGTPGPLGIPSNNITGLRRIQDNEIQIAAQPAASGIFRVQTVIGVPIEDGTFDAGTDGDFAPYNLRGEIVSPLFESGIVDVATASFIDIKQRMTQVYARQPGIAGSPLQFFAPTPADVYTLRDRPGQIPNLGGGGNTLFLLSPREVAAYRQERINAGVPASAVPFGEEFPANANVTGLQTLVQMQHAWMADALPGRSNELRFEGETSWTTIPEIDFDWRGVDTRILANSFTPQPAYNRSDYEITPSTRVPRSRMRYEKSPPGYNADVFGPDAATQTSPVLQAAYRADQQVIGSSQFIPRCTEFIVEYSFGEIDLDTQRTIWYGHDPDGRAYPDDTNPDRAGYVEWLRPNVARPEHTTPFDPTIANSRRIQRDIEKHLRADLVNGEFTENPLQKRRLEGAPLRYPLSHYFGYADPRAVPLDLNNDGIIDGYDMNDDGVADDLDGDGRSTDEWPWPKLIRITLSFADPIDQTTEETFQFVIEVPSGEGI